MACLLGLLLAPAAAGAFTYLRGGAVAVDGPYLPPNTSNVTRELFDETSADGTLRASVAVTPPSGLGPLADAGGEVSHGVVRARAYAILSSAGVYQAGADTEARFSDELTFTSPGRAGLQGSVTFGMRIDGTLSSRSTQPEQQLKGSSEAWIELGAESSVDEEHLDRYAYSASADGSGERLEAAEFTLALGIVFGEPVDVGFSLQVLASVFGHSSQNASGTWAATGIADFRHTATWMGILELRDAEGAAVSEFEVTSASGTDYRGPIAAPEPGRSVLLLAGAAVLLAKSCRRRPEL
jgi:hypothetical protein